MKIGVPAIAALALFVVSGSALAHHSFAMFDPERLLIQTGTVKEFEWTNPHVRFYVDVKDDKGNVTNWDLELMSVNTLTRAGWDRHALNVGDVVTVTFYMAKDGSKRGNARGNVELANGKKIFSAGDARGTGAER